jgi:hypothetical protein
MQFGHDGRPFSDRTAHAFDRSRTNVSDRENAKHVGFQRERANRAAVGSRVERMAVHARLDELPFIQGDA